MNQTRVYPPELFPTRVRGKAVALSTAGELKLDKKVPFRKLKADWLFLISFILKLIATNRKLGLQLRSQLLRPTFVRAHPMEDLHLVRCLLRHHDHPRLLHVPRISGKELGRSRRYLQLGLTSMEDWQIEKSKQAQRAHRSHQERRRRRCSILKGPNCSSCFRFNSI